MAGDSVNIFLLKSARGPYAFIVLWPDLCGAVLGVAVALPMHISCAYIAAWALLMGRCVHRQHQALSGLALLFRIT